MTRLDYDPILLCDFNNTYLKKVAEYLVEHNPESTFQLDVDFRRLGDEAPDFRLRGPKGKEKRFKPLTFQNKTTATDLASLQSYVDESRLAFFVSMDRVYLNPLSHFEKEVTLNGYMSGWLSLLHTFKSPGVAVFQNTPHFPWDIALCAALEALGWRVFAIRPSILSGTVTLSRIVRGLPESSSRLQAEEQGNVSFDPESLLASNNRVNASKNANKSFNEWLVKKAARHTKFRHVIKLVQLAISGPKMPYWGASRFAHVIALLKWLALQVRLRKWILNNSCPIPKGKFAIFFLHFQPERSTTPEAEVFWFQYRAIVELAASVPKGTRVMVKEHPRQLGNQEPDLRQLNFRSVEFYQLVSEIDGVSFLSPEVSSEEALRRAVVVATCTGSAGLEAIVLGKKAIAFGSPWYENLGGVTIRNGMEPRLKKYLSEEPLSTQSDRAERERAFRREVNFCIPGLHDAEASLAGNEVLDKPIPSLANVILGEASACGVRSKQ